MKPRINVYLEDHVAAQLTLICKRPGSNKSRIVSDALDNFFNPERETETNTALIRRLDRMSVAMARLDRNQSIEVETLALFIRYFLTITPPLPASEQAPAHALGKERFDVFVAQVGRRLAHDKNLLSEVLERIADTSPDLFAVDSERATTSQSTGDAEKPTAPENAFPPLRPVIVEDDDAEFSEDEFIEDMEWEGDDDR